MYFLIVCYFLPIGFTVAFEVSAPQRQVLAVYGQPAVLGCVFSPSSGTSLDSLVITWQRENDSKVLHSFFYGKDQLDQQGPSYRNRTGLYLAQLQNGNASLRLEKVQPEDSGWYQCSVSSLHGTRKASVQVKFAAYYTEPQLTIQVHRANISFHYKSTGYPKPEVWWLNHLGQNLFHDTEIFSSGNNGLFLLSTRLVLDARENVNYTFNLKNQLLDQVIERSLVFNGALKSDSNCPGRIPLGPILLTVYVLGGFVFLLWYRLRKKH